MNNKFNQINCFDAKRNCAMTMLIPPNYNFRRDTLNVRRRIKSMKHKHKRYQLLRVIKELWNRIRDIKEFENLGCILCCGLNKKDEIKFYDIEPNKIIEKFEYFYGDYFNHLKINEYLYTRIKYIIDENEKKNLIKEIDERMLNDQLVYYNKIDDFLDTNLMSKIIFFSNEKIPDNILSRLLLSDLELYIFNAEKIDNFVIKNNKYIGFIRYNLKFTKLNM